MSRHEPGTDAELVRRAATLQDEATRLIEQLRMVPMLSEAGEVEQVGSSVMGLMVWRDLDIVVHSPDLSTARVFASLRPLFDAPGLISLYYRDERGPRSPTGDGRDGRHYVVLHHEWLGEGRWKVDLTFWTALERHDHAGYAASIAVRMTDETRLAILRLKDAWYRRPTYPDTVGGHDIYVAVLEHGVRTVDEFAAHLRERGLPDY